MRYVTRRRLGKSADLLGGEGLRFAAQLIGKAPWQLAKCLNPADDDETTWPRRQSERSTTKARRDRRQRLVRQVAEERQVAEQWKPAWTR